MRRVAVIGVGMTKFGEHWEKSIRELIVEAGARAIEDAGIHGRDIEAIYGANMSAGRFANQEHIGALIADHMGLVPKPTVRLEAACASGGVAFREGYIAVASGAYDMGVVGGVEKMTDVLTEEAASILGLAGDYEWEVFKGATFPTLYALMARRHMHEYGTTEEQLAMVAVKNHENAVLNPFAQFRKRISVEDVLASPVIASPLKLLDCSPLSDGAAAVVLASEEKVRELKIDTPVWIRASAQASDTLALHDRKDLTTLLATRVAAEQAYKQAKVEPKDIDVAEVHDCFTIAEILAIEDLGFFKKGEGGKAVEEGQTARNAKISVNTSGGLKACGHPVGATGVKQIVELTLQLRGDAGERQVTRAELGLAHNVGGSGATCVVHILSR